MNGAEFDLSRFREKEKGILKPEDSSSLRNSPNRGQRPRVTDFAISCHQRKAFDDCGRADDSIRRIFGIGTGQQETLQTDMGADWNHHEPALHFRQERFCAKRESEALLGRDSRKLEQRNVGNRKPTRGTSRLVDCGSRIFRNSSGIKSQPCDNMSIEQNQ